MRTVVLVLISWAALAVGAACEPSCPGRICHDCSGAGDCDITCQAGEVIVCRAEPEGDLDSPNRCVYCE